MTLLSWGHINILFSGTVATRRRAIPLDEAFFSIKYHFIRSVLVGIRLRPKLREFSTFMNFPGYILAIAWWRLFAS